MQVITTLTSSPNQLHRLVLDNNETADFILYYSGRMQAWYYDIEYNDITVRCSKVVLTPNSLRQLKNILPFGITFYSESDIEPFQITDFVTGRVKMAVLNSDEVQEIETTVYNL